MSPDTADTVERESCKFGANVTELRWGDTRAYIAGCEDVTHTAHNLQAEWNRASQWTDHNGKV